MHRSVTAAVGVALILLSAVDASAQSYDMGFGGSSYSSCSSHSSVMTSYSSPMASYSHSDVMYSAPMSYSQPIESIQPIQSMSYGSSFTGYSQPSPMSYGFSSYSSPISYGSASYAAPISYGVPATSYAVPASYTAPAGNCPNGNCSQQSSFGGGWSFGF